MFARRDFVAEGLGKFSDKRLKAPSDWMEKLYLVMEGYRNQGEIRTVDALLMKLLDGDVVAKDMLKHILSWQKHSIRTDGAVWRSAKEWKQHTGLSKSAVYNQARRERLQKAGMRVWVEKAWGENCLHFRITDAKFLANICAAMGMNYSVGMMAFYDVVDEKKPAPSSQTKPPIAFPQAGSSQTKSPSSFTQILITESTTSNTTKETTSVLFNSVPLSVKEKEKYACLDRDVVQKIFDTANELKKTGKLKKPMLAYVRAALKLALEGHEQLAAPLAAREENPSPLPPSHSAAQSDSTPPLNSLPEIERGTIPMASEEIDFSSPEWRWSATMTQLEYQLDRNSFLSWVKGAKFCSVEDGVYIVEVKSDYARDVLQGRLYRNVRRTLSDVCGMATEIRFEVMGGQS